MRRKLHSTTSGFTLIELLVVVAIIAILISILLPSLAAARDQSKQVQCGSQLGQFGKAFYLYAGENRDVLCSGQSDARPAMNYPATIEDQAVIGIDRVGWIADLVNTKSAPVGEMLCPSNPGRQTQAIGRIPSSQLTQDYYNYLLAQGYNTNYVQAWYLVHTGPNASAAAINDNDKSFLDKSGVRMDLGPLRTTALTRISPSAVPLIADARADLVGNVFNQFGKTVRETKAVTDGPLWFYREDGTRQDIGYSKSRPWGSQDWDDMGPAHGRRGVFHKEGTSFVRANMLFADGSVRTFTDKYEIAGDGKVYERPNGELDSADMEGKCFDGVLELGRRSNRPDRLE